MLEQICEHIHNYFTEDSDIHAGVFAIEDGVIDLEGLIKNGQYFRIVGSALNDGVYKYPIDPEAQALSDEVWVGEIWAMRVPKAVVDISKEVAAWQAKYGAAAASPFQSENVIGVYSYAKSAGIGGADGGTWENAFRSRLNPWRKLR